MTCARPRWSPRRETGAHPCADPGGNRHAYILRSMSNPGANTEGAMPQEIAGFRPTEAPVGRGGGRDGWGEQ
jgi:hypothetical protein